MRHISLDRLFFYIKRISIYKSLWYSLRHKSVILVSSSVRIVKKKSAKIHFCKKSIVTIGLEYDSTIEPVNIVLEDNAELIFNGKCSIKKGVQISLGKNAIMSLGDKTYINERSKIIIYEMCRIGNECAISWDVTITDSDVHKLDERCNKQEVVIGDNVWIGFGSSIIKGSYVGNGSVVAACSLINNKFDDYCLIAGVPAKIKKRNIKWV